jgi:hypothetical protein
MRCRGRRSNNPLCRDRPAIEHGFWPYAERIRRKHVAILENAKPYIIVSLFEDFGHRIVLPNLANVCRNPVLAGQEALLLVDNGKPQVRDPVKKVLEENGVVSVTYAPHAADMLYIFQMLYLSPFGVFTTLQTREKTSNREWRSLFILLKQFRLCRTPLPGSGLHSEEGNLEWCVSGTNTDRVQ